MYLTKMLRDFTRNDDDNVLLSMFFNYVALLSFSVTGKELEGTLPNLKVEPISVFK